VLKCALVGCVLTCIVQSSSATLGITIGLAATGVIPFHTAAALVLGENIGTTITAWLACVGATTNAKRAAYAHILFNVIGVMWITAIFTFYITGLEWFYGLLGIDPNLEVISAGGQLVDSATFVLRDGKEWLETAAGPALEVTRSYPHVTKGIALVHSLFNVVNVILFLPFTRLLAAGLNRFVAEKAYREAPHLTALETRNFETPAIGLERSRMEILRMGAHVQKAMDCMRSILAGDELPDGEVGRKIFHREEILDTMQREIVVFLTKMLSESVPHDLVVEARKQIRMADEYESVSDYIANILKMYTKMKHDGTDFAPEGQQAMAKLHEAVDEYVKMVNVAFEQRNPDIITKAHAQGSAINRLVKEFHQGHLARLSTHAVSPLASVTHTNMLNAYRRIKDHMQNVAEAMASHD